MIRKHPHSGSQNSLSWHCRRALSRGTSGRSGTQAKTQLFFLLERSQLEARNLCRKLSSASNKVLLMRCTLARPSWVVGCREKKGLLHARCDIFTSAYKTVTGVVAWWFSLSSDCHPSIFFLSPFGACYSAPARSKGAPKTRTACLYSFCTLHQLAGVAVL